MASVVERVLFNADSVGTATINFTAAVEADDVVVVICTAYARDSLPTLTASGLGATWTSLARYTTGDARTPSTEVFIGQAASDGNVTVTPSLIWRGGYYAVLLRDLTTTTSIDTVALTSSGTSISGPSQSAGPGQVVIAHGSVIGGSTSWDIFEGYTPSTGWLTNAKDSTGIYCETGGAVRVPASIGTHQVSDSQAVHDDYRIVQLVVGEAAAPIPEAASPSPLASTVEPFGNPSILLISESPSPIGSSAEPIAEAPIPVAASPSPIRSVVGPFGAGNVHYPTTTVYAKAPSAIESRAVPDLRPADVPATITDWPVTVEAHTMPALSAELQRITPGLDYEPLRGVAGRYRVFVDGQDVTFLRDVPTLVEDYSSSDPMGDDGARFVCKQIHPWDVLGTGDLSMFDMDSDPPVDIAFEDESGDITHLWDGHIASQGDDATSNDEGRTFVCEGTLKAAAHQPWTPPTYMEPTDPGVVVARAMNAVISRRYASFVEVETGLPPIVYRGSQSQSHLDYALEVLSKMWTDDGRQWSFIKVGPRQYKLGLKAPMDDYDAAIVKGAQGVDVRLVLDESMRVDGYFGQGIAPNGGQWGNFFFPGLDLFIPPPYPYADTTQTIYIGDTDAGTTTGDGVSVAQARLVELGYAVAVDGTYNSADAAAVTQMQTDFGLLVDGRIGPQTWSSLFSPGVNEVDLGRIRLPLVAKPWVWPTLHAANGAVTGTNPAHEAKQPMPVPKLPNINFGSDITKAEATNLARRMLEANGEAAWTGSIGLLTDLVAPDGVTPISRFLVREGWRIKVIGHDGDTIVRVGDASKDGLSVSLMVDERARDALTLDAIAARDRDARKEVAPRRPGNPSKISSLIRDHVTQFEDESKAGKIPSYPVNGNVGLWSAFPIFVSQTGVISIFELSARNVTTTFSVAIFGKPIQPQVLASYVPDPINDGSGWRDHYDTLTLDHGLCAIYGEPGALGGYAPRVQSDGGPITGDLYDDSGFPFVSEVGGYLWVAVFASASCTVSGRAFPAVPQ